MGIEGQSSSALTFATFKEPCLLSKLFSNFLSSAGTAGPAPTLTILS